MTMNMTIAALVEVGEGEDEDDGTIEETTEAVDTNGTENANVNHHLHPQLPTSPMYLLARKPIERRMGLHREHHPRPILQHPTPMIPTAHRRSLLPHPLSFLR